MRQNDSKRLQRFLFFQGALYSLVAVILLYNDLIHGLHFKANKSLALDNGCWSYWPVQSNFACLLENITRMIAYFGSSKIMIWFYFVATFILICYLRLSLSASVLLCTFILFIFFPVFSVSILVHPLIGLALTIGIAYAIECVNRTWSRSMKMYLCLAIGCSMVTIILAYVFTLKDSRLLFWLKPLDDFIIFGWTRWTLGSVI